MIGISLDEDLKLLQEMVASKSMSWPQVWDQDETVRKLFNVKGTPSYHVIDKEGNIAAKDLASFKKLSAAVEDLLKKP